MAIMLNTQAMMFAMLPKEPLPTRGMPHSGLMPTGAVVGLGKVTFAVRGSLESCNGVAVSIRQRVGSTTTMESRPDDRTDYTKDKTETENRKV